MLYQIYEFFFHVGSMDGRIFFMEVAEELIQFCLSSYHLNVFSFNFWSSRKSRVINSKKKEEAYDKVEI